VSASSSMWERPRPSGSGAETAGTAENSSDPPMWRTNLKVNDDQGDHCDDNDRAGSKKFDE
jgi:hypothetical protein